MAILCQHNEKALIPKFWGWLWILNRLVKVGYMYFFYSLYSIQSHNLCYLLINISFFLTSINFISSLPLPFHSLDLNHWIKSLSLTCTLITLLYTWPNHLKWLSLIFFINPGYPIIKQFSSFFLCSLFLQEWLIGLRNCKGISCGMGWVIHPSCIWWVGIRGVLLWSMVV